MTLPEYWVMWMPALVVLSALGIGELFSIAAQHRAIAGRVAVGVVGGVAVGLVVASSSTELARVLTQPRVGGAVVADIRARYHLNGELLAGGTDVAEIAPYLPGVVTLTAVPADLGAVDTVVIGQPRCELPVPRTIAAFVRANVATGRLRGVHADRLVRVYIATAPLLAPTHPQIKAQPPASVADWL